MSELQRMRQESMELGRQLGKQEVVRTLNQCAEQGIITQEAMQTILRKIKNFCTRLSAKMIRTSLLNRFLQQKPRVGFLSCNFFLFPFLEYVIYGERRLPFFGAKNFLIEKNKRNQVACNPATYAFFCWKRNLFFATNAYRKGIAGSVKANV